MFFSLSIQNWCDSTLPKWGIILNCAWSSMGSPAIAIEMQHSQSFQEISAVELNRIDLSTSSNCVTFECLGSQLPCASLVMTFVKRFCCMCCMNTFWFQSVFADAHVDLIGRQRRDYNVGSWMAFRPYEFECVLGVATAVRMLCHRFRTCMARCVYGCAS